MATLPTLPLSFAFDALQQIFIIKTAFLHSLLVFNCSILILVVVKAALGEDEPVLLVGGEHLGRLHLQVALHVLQAVQVLLLHDGEVGGKPVLVHDAIVELSATHLDYHLQASTADFKS